MASKKVKKLMASIVEKLEGIEDENFLSLLDQLLDFFGGDSGEEDAGEDDAGEDDAEEDAGDDDVEEEIKGMNLKQLKKYIKDNELDVDPDDYPKLSKLQAAVIEAMAESGGEGEGEGEEEEVTAEDIEGMSKSDLLSFIEDNELDVDPDDYPKLSKLKEAVIEAAGIGEDSGEDDDDGEDSGLLDEDDEDEKPRKKPAKSGKKR